MEIYQDYYGYRYKLNNIIYELNILITTNKKKNK